MTQETVGREVRPTVPVVTTHEALSEVVDFYTSVDEFVIDVETVGDHRADPRRNEVLWVGLATQGRSDVIPLGHPNGHLVEIKRGVLPAGAARLMEGKALRKGDVSKAEARARKVWSEPPPQLSPGEVFEALRPVLFGPATKIGANIKFDLESVSKYYRGELPPPQYGDVIIADFLLDDTNIGRMGLAHLCKRHLGYEMPKGVGKSVESYSFQEVAKYLYGDVKFTWLLWKKLQKLLSDAGVSSVMRLEMDCLEAVMHMEQAGTLIDVEAMKVLRDELTDGLSDLTGRAYQVAGETFNVNSVQDKRRLLFDVRGLEPKVFTDKTGEPSTNEAALKYHSKDPLVSCLLQIADLRKLESTYVIPYLGGEVTRTSAGKSKTEHRESLLVNQRVHTSFKQHGARTGRMSSNSPNLQNIPSRGPYGQRIRGMFIADPGHALIAGDYAQIEPRIMASLSNDRVLIDAFQNNRDIYQTIADQLEVDRKTGKILILAMAYGIGPGKIGADLGLSQRAARQLLEDFRQGFPALDRYKSEVVNAAMRRRPVPYVKTILGRRRLIRDLVSPDPDRRARGQRQAFNSRIQGSAADVMKIALVRAQRMMPDGCKLLLTVHDEIVASAPEDIVHEAVAALREAMEGIQLPQIKVPLKTDIGTGNSWAEAK